MMRVRYATLGARAYCAHLVVPNRDATMWLPFLVRHGATFSSSIDEDRRGQHTSTPFVSMAV